MTDKLPINLHDLLRQRAVSRRYRLTIQGRQWLHKQKAGERHE
jgi:hypothetical protein